MAYVSEEVINKARTALKALNKQYGVKATLSGKGSSSLCLTIAEGSVDFIGSYCNGVAVHPAMTNATEAIRFVQQEQHIQVNQYYLDTFFSGASLEYLEKAKAIMYADHWDKSDVMTDYFNCSYYVSIRVGRWNKGYKLVK